MTCCSDFDKLMDLELARHAQPYQLTNGRIITEIDTEYYLVFGEERHNYVGINYCPFCGRVLSSGTLESGEEEAGVAELVLRFLHRFEQSGHFRGVVQDQ